MGYTSVYSLECVCGRQIETEERTLSCPSCHRELVIEWGRDDKRDSGVPEAGKRLSVSAAA
jgi:hypothetical protein